MKVEFTGNAARCVGGVSFEAVVDGQKVQCRISEEALQDHCGAADDSSDMVSAYKRAPRASKCRG